MHVQQNTKLRKEQLQYRDPIWGTPYVGQQSPPNRNMTLRNAVNSRISSAKYIVITNT